MSTPTIATPAPALATAIEAVMDFMKRWETAHPDHSQMSWILARHDFVQTLAISLWHDAGQETRKKALSFAWRNNS